MNMLYQFTVKLYSSMCIVEFKHKHLLGSYFFLANYVLFYKDFFFKDDV